MEHYLFDWIENIDSTATENIRYWQLFSNSGFHTALLTRQYWKLNNLSLLEANHCTENYHARTIGATINKTITRRQLLNIFQQLPIL